MSGLLHVPAALTPGIGWWIGLRTGPHRNNIFIVPARNRTLVVQLVVTLLIELSRLPVSVRVIGLRRYR
jgi:hypothetical protein